MEITEGVHSIELSWRFDEPLTVQVIDQEEATVVLGGGDESTTAEYRSILDRFSVDVVLVEHGDPDHFGSLLDLGTHRGGIEIAVPKGDATFLDEAGIDVDYPLEGEKEYWGIETISVPGHTPDNMAYRHGDVLLAGDTVVGSDSLFAADYPWSGDLAVINPDYNFDDESAKENLEVLAGYDFDAVLVTHGSNVLQNGPRELDKLLTDLE